MTWPPGKGVTRLPRLGAHPSQQAAFHAYMSAFSNADFERFPAFYTKDVRLELGSVPPITSRQGIIDFYRLMFARVREHLTVNSVVATDNAIELDAVTRFTAVEDAPDFVVGPLKQGEYLEGASLSATGCAMGSYRILVSNGAARCATARLESRGNWVADVARGERLPLAVFAALSPLSPVGRVCISGVDPGTGSGGLVARREEG